MMSLEENRVLAYLREHHTAEVTAVLGACTPGAAVASLGRLLANLEWLGYVVVYHDEQGQPLLLQITEKGNQSSLSMVAG